jgi:3-oxoacyl-[acyl-carrier protein] reductase
MPLCLVTGSSRGIGRATALALAADGWTVAVHYRSRAEEAETVAAAIRAAGGSAQTFCADVSNAAQAAALVKAVETALGPITALVCNAGVIRTQFTAMTAAEDWRAVLATNLDGAFYCTKAVIRGMMRQRSGRIVYVSSDAALLGDLMRPAYSASKAGLLGLARSVARELAPSGITVNAVAPGVIATDMTADMPETRRVKQLAAIPLNRFGEPGEVASVIRCFLSPRAAYITGQVFSVDGGLCMH